MFQFTLFVLVMWVVVIVVIRVVWLTEFQAFEESPDSTTMVYRRLRPILGEGNWKVSGDCGKILLVGFSLNIFCYQP